jgi:hypothetical protein
VSTPRWDPGTVEKLRRDLLATVEREQTGRHLIREWELSGVERLHLSDGTSMVFKFATAPFTAEAAVLRVLRERGAAVPALHAWAVRNHTLGMLMDDLGEPLRHPTDVEAATAAVRLHTLPPIPSLPTFDEATLAQLPEQALNALHLLHHQQRFLNADGIEELLTRLAEVAERRADGAERQPYGLCHGEFHPTSLHVNATGCRLIDWAKAFHGPGLLDLATWFGTRTPATPDRLTLIIHIYVSQGGHPDAEADRGGVPATQWALGWHRIWAAWWYLTNAAAGHHHPETDTRHTNIIRRQLADAAALLAPAPLKRPLPPSVVFFPTREPTRTATHPSETSEPDRSDGLPAVDAVFASQRDQRHVGDHHAGRGQFAEFGETGPYRRGRGAGAAVGDGDVRPEPVRAFRHRRPD